MTDTVFIYITHPDLDGAKSLGRDLVEQRIAACANIFPGMQTIYRWQGKVEEGSETVMIVKTRQELLPAVQAYVRAHHPYECPCIVALPVSGGSQAYLDWVVDATATAYPGR